MCHGATKSIRISQNREDFQRMQKKKKKNYLRLTANIKLFKGCVCFTFYIFSTDYMVQVLFLCNYIVQTVVSETVDNIHKNLNK